MPRSALRRSPLRPKKEILRYLTTHLIGATRDLEAGARVSLDSDRVKTVVGGVDAFASGLKLTRYGQMAIVLDPTGTLASLAEGQPAAEVEVVELPDPWDA